MAYEGMTYEFILNRMMNRVAADYPNLDRREGSIIFNALAPAALELAIAYTELANTLNESFVTTATREYLLLACQQIGVDTSIFNATAGKHRAEFDVEVSIGSRWNCDLYNYYVTEYIGMVNDSYVYELQCETTGTAPNNVTGFLTPLDAMPSGLTYANLVECVIEGENETDDEGIRNTYFEYVNNTIGEGNVAQYERWCIEYPDGGIGNHKIIPLWNGANTVKVSILSASNRAASDELVADFQEYLDPGTTGMGDGQAPIGAFVTVTTATEIPIEISADVSMKSGYTDTSSINTALENYFAEIAYEKNMVGYMTIGATILGAECVESLSNLRVNGGTGDIVIGTEEIPVLGNTNWTVI